MKRTDGQKQTVVADALKDLHAVDKLIAYGRIEKAIELHTELYITEMGLIGGSKKLGQAMDNFVQEWGKRYIKIAQKKGIAC